MAIHPHDPDTAYIVPLESDGFRCVPEAKLRVYRTRDAGKSWKSIVKDWAIVRCGEEPKDFWSQSMCYGSAKIEGPASKALVRFHNSGRRNYLRAEAHLIYRTHGADATKVTYDWSDETGRHTESHVVSPAARSDSWKLATASNVETRWVEMEDVTP